MAARISSDTTDLTKSQNETGGKKTRASAKADEVAAAVRTIQEKVDKLRDAHAEKVKAIEDAMAEIEKLKQQRQQMEQGNQTAIDQISPQHTQAKEALLDEEKRLDHMDWKTDMMNKKMEDMHASSGMMTRAVTKTEISIDKLQEELDELNIQIQSTQSIIEDLKHSISTLDSRQEMLDKNQRDMMKDRNAVLQQHESD